MTPDLVKCDSQSIHGNFPHIKPFRPNRIFPLMADTRDSNAVRLHLQSAESPFTASPDTWAERFERGGHVFSHTLRWSFNEGAAFGLRVHGAVRTRAPGLCIDDPAKWVSLSRTVRPVSPCSIVWYFIHLVLRDKERWWWLKNEMWMTLLGNKARSGRSRQGRVHSTFIKHKTGRGTKCTLQ